MRLVIRTKVKGYYVDVMKQFDLSLFEALKPPMVNMEVVDFTGSQTGDRVHIKFLSPIRSEWISDITDHGQDEKQAYFVDEGTVLPFPLKKWKHRHIVEKVDSEYSLIVDDITFSGPNFIIDLFLYPMMYLSFLPRKRVYRSYFNR